MEVDYSEQALVNIAFWKKSGNLSVQKKISRLIQSIQETPFQGIGKPEPLNMSCRANGLAAFQMNIGSFMKYSKAGFAYIPYEGITGSLLPSSSTAIGSDAVNQC